MPGYSAGRRPASRGRGRAPLPPSAARAVLPAAAVLAAVIWVAGQALGGVLTGGGTDLDTARC